MFVGLTNHAKLLYFIKIYRIFKGLKNFNVPTLMDKLHDFQILSTKKKIKNNPLIGNDII